MAGLAKAVTVTPKAEASLAPLTVAPVPATLAGVDLAVPGMAAVGVARGLTAAVAAVNAGDAMTVGAMEVDLRPVASTSRTLLNIPIGNPLSRQSRSTFPRWKRHSRSSA